MEKKVLKIALTGGIASGKTLVSDLLEIHGCYIIDLDIISREVVLPGSDGLKELVEAFGKSILLSDGRHLIVKICVMSSLKKEEIERKLSRYFIQRYSRK